MAWWVVLLEEGSNSALVGASKGTGRTTASLTVAQALVGTTTGRGRVTADLTLGGTESWSGGWWGALMDESGLAGATALVGTSRGRGRLTANLTGSWALTGTTRGRTRTTADLTVTGSPSTPWIDPGGPYGIPLYPPPLLQNFKGRTRFTADLTNGQQTLLIATSRGQGRFSPVGLLITAAPIPATVSLTAQETVTLTLTAREAYTVTLTASPTA